MSGHFPFAGKLGIRYGLAPRMTISAFFELKGYNDTLQEKYYRFWYEWAKNYIENDADLSYSKGVLFKKYPYGQHAHENFHLNNKYWASTLADLGDLIRDIIFPKMTEAAMHNLEDAHHHMMEELKKEVTENPRPPVPDTGYFRHV